MAKGREEGIIEIARRLKAKGYSHQKIEEMIGVKIKD
jgi:broad-specificity NMP kinase